MLAYAVRLTAQHVLPLRGTVPTAGAERLDGTFRRAHDCAAVRHPYLLPVTATMR